jgi:pimeloyl-ACP methyl ester carboxylesterase
VIDYSATGQGPVLLLCPGGDGDPAGVAALAAQLSDAWTVITYRRGAHPTIAEHAADAAAVLDQVGGGPVAVFGSSFGGLVALELVLGHPIAVSTLVAHEPPLLAVLPADDPAPAQMHAMHTSAAADMRSAGPLVLATTGTRMDEWEDAPPTSAPDPARLGVMQRFFAEVAPAAERYAPDPAAIRAAAATTRIVPAVGTTATGHFPYRCAEALGRLVDVPVARMPGAHNAMITHPRAFAAALRELLTITS